MGVWIGADPTTIRFPIAGEQFRAPPKATIRAADRVRENDPFKGLDCPDRTAPQSQDGRGARSRTDIFAEACGCRPVRRLTSLCGSFHPVQKSGPSPQWFISHVSEGIRGGGWGRGFASLMRMSRTARGRLPSVDPSHPYPHRSTSSQPRKTCETDHFVALASLRSHRLRLLFSWVAAPPRQENPRTPRRAGN